MKWLIISNSVEKTEAVHSFLELCGKGEDCVSDFMLNSSSKKLLPILEKHDHYIVLFSLNPKDDMSSDSIISCRNSIIFTAAFCIGRKNKIFGAGDTNILCDAGIPPSVCFKNADMLLSLIRDSYNNLKTEQLQKDAHTYLFDCGMPFTPDAFAAYINKNDLDVCEKYITAGMDVNARTSDGTPMLNVAVRAENQECVEWLCKHGAYLNAMSEDRGYTAIMDAVWRGNKDLVQFFVEKGVNMNTVSKEGQTMLVLAVGAGRKDICEILAMHGENPYVPDAMGMSAYAYAKLFKQNEIVAIFEKKYKEI